MTSSIGPVPQHRSSLHSVVLERQALAFHYEYAALTRNLSFPPDTVHVVEFAGGAGVVYLASTGARHVALYAFAPAGAGRRFRRLSPDVADRDLYRALLETTSADIAGLARLGLSYREIAAVAGTSLERLQSMFLGVS